MRHFINIVESTSGFIPDFKQFVTPALISHMLQTGVWSPHGSSLDDWWDEGALDYFDGEDEGLAGCDLAMAVQQDRPAVESIIHRFLIARAGWVIRNLTSGEHGIAPLTLESPLNRAICVNEEWIAAIGSPRRGALPLGIYWGTEGVEPWGAHYDEVHETSPHVVRVTTQVKHVHIDWQQTFLSRVDWLNGDDEQEIQLARGSEIGHVVEIVYQSSNTRPDLARAEAQIAIHPSATFIA